MAAACYSTLSFGSFFSVAYFGNLGILALCIRARVFWVWAFSPATELFFLIGSTNVVYPGELIQRSSFDLEADEFSFGFLIRGVANFKSQKLPGTLPFINLSRVTLQFLLFTKSFLDLLPSYNFANKVFLPKVSAAN